MRTSYTILDPVLLRGEKPLPDAGALRHHALREETVRYVVRERELAFQGCPDVFEFVITYRKILFDNQKAHQSVPGWPTR